MSWKCSCGLVNGGTNKHCAASLTWTNIEHKQTSANAPDWIMAFLTGKELNMTPNEELFTKFYNHEKILVKDMDTSMLREHRDELSRIAFEAKARLVASDDETRERKAKSSALKDWSVTTHDVSVTDAINVVKARKERMTKMDRMREQLLKAGIDEDTVNEMVSGLEKRVSDKTLKTITFNKPTTEVSAVRVTTKAEVSSEPFNPTALKFKS